MEEDRFGDEVKILLLIVLFVAIGHLLPRFTIPEFVTKDINFISDILRDTTPKSSVADTLISNDSLLLSEVKLPEIEEAEKITDVKVKEDKPEEQVKKSNDSQYTLFEDYSLGKTGLYNLNKAIANSTVNQRPIRIAFLGDSFIEGDIITSDIRERLQQIYGGRGVGFMPIVSSAATYRKTIVHKFNGWKTYSMLAYKEADLTKLMLSGQYFIPSEGATVSFKGTNAHKFIDKFNSARLLFINEKNSTIEIVVNEDKVQTYTPESSTKLQSIELKGEIHSVEITIKNVDGFTCFGMLLNDYQGIYVDNFSLRGSSGMVLSIVNKELVEEMKPFLTYDLIVLQYGLNVASPSAKNYNGYHKAMIAVIKHLKQCYPNTDIVIMGVGDRSVRGPMGFDTMDGISKMIDTQRDLAVQTGCMFWDTFEAMGGRGSMIKFVSNKPPLANKDYTHINYEGGKKIASSFVDAMTQALSKKEQ